MQKYKHLSLLLQKLFTFYNLNANLQHNCQVGKKKFPAETKLLVFMIIGSKKIFVEKLSSTNSHAAWLLRKGKVQDGTVVHTLYQTAGRGQADNKWESESGKNLLISIIIFPNFIRAERQFTISKMISLGIRDYLVSLCSDVTIKWPNDIYVRNDKIAGILIENAVIRYEIEHTIAGIGLNVNQVKFPASVSGATSLRLSAGREFGLDDCLNNLLGSIDRRYRQLSGNKKTGINSDYINALYHFNQWTEFRDSRGVFEGKIIAVTDIGRLQIEDRKGRIYEYEHGEVDFL